MKINFKTINTSHVISIAIFFATIAIVISIWTSNSKRSHKQMVMDWRKQKDNYFRSDDGSPIINKENHSKLIYFAPDIKYRVTARLTLLHDTIPVTLLRTDGKKEQYHKYALASFTLDKKNYQLTLFRSVSGHSVNENVLFVPFTDQTTGISTYKSGRYLDIEIKNTKEIVIDFNYAYNPFCAYNPRFSCPIPPLSNFLDTEILAGEKSF